MNFETFGHLLPLKVIFGPQCPQFLEERSYMDNPDHIFLVESPYMDQAHFIFLVEVHIWTTLTTYFGMKPNLKPISQKQIPSPMPQTQSQTGPIPNLHPKPNCEPISQKPNPRPKPISQAHIPNPIPNLIPNLYPKPNPNPRVFLR